jgi:hypothetical protein
MSEVQQGIDLLRSLFRDERSWAGDSKYGLLFGTIAGCIEADYRTLLEGDGEISFLELIKWAYRHQLYQQVLTLIESNAPTNIVSNGVFYYCNDEAHVDEVKKLLALQRLEMRPHEYYKMDPVEHYFVKVYDRASVKLSGGKGEDRNLAYAMMRAKSIENNDPAKITGYTACSNIETVQEVLYAYFHLGTVRNKISHAESTAMAEYRPDVAENEISSAMILMKQTIEYFITSYEKAVEETRGTNPKIVTITSDEVRNVAERLKREKYQDKDSESQQSFKKKH